MVKTGNSENKNGSRRHEYIFMLMFLGVMMVGFVPRGHATEEEMIQSVDEVKEREAKTLDLLSTIDAFTEEDERLRTDAAKAHYNMGNIYYQKGDFEVAVREYYQAVTLMPNDPDAHFNLAFVSGEHLKDFKTALKHYQIYLYLYPEASDANFVKEKIVHAQLTLKSKIDSEIDEVK